MIHVLTQLHFFLIINNEKMRKFHAFCEHVFWNRNNNTYFTKKVSGNACNPVFYLIMNNLKRLLILKGILIFLRVGRRHHDFVSLGGIFFFKIVCSISHEVRWWNWPYFWHADTSRTPFWSTQFFSSVIVDLSTVSYYYSNGFLLEILHD